MLSFTYDNYSLTITLSTPDNARLSIGKNCAQKLLSVLALVLTGSLTSTM